MLSFFYVIVGIVLLSVGGDVLIRGSLGLAQRLRLSPLLCGLIIVGFGTSAPELVVSVDAALKGQPDIALGNVVGSNIGNILLILGLCALIAPMAVKPLALRRDALTVLFSSALFVVMVGVGALGSINALVLLLLFTGYLLWAYRSESAATTPVSAVHQQEGVEVSVIPLSGLLITGSIVAGLGLLILGSKILIVGAVDLATYYQVSEALIGLTLVAIGTSLPELSVSIIAALRRHADVAVGNILGSNIFNVLGILGISSLLQELEVHQRILEFDRWVLLGSSIVLLLFLYTGRRLSRVEGGILLALYVAYIYLSFAIF